jgi:hypothetical protein
VRAAARRGRRSMWPGGRRTGATEYGSSRCCSERLCSRTAPGIGADAGANKRVPLTPADTVAPGRSGVGERRSGRRRLIALCGSDPSGCGCAYGSATAGFGVCETAVPVANSGPPAAAPS